MGLAISTSTGEGPAVVALDGELDLATASCVQHAVLDALGASDAVVVDLSDVTFLDATGLGTLLRCRREASASGRWCVLSSPSRCVRRLAGLTGTEAALGLAPAELPGRALVDASGPGGEPTRA